MVHQLDDDAQDGFPKYCFNPRGRAMSGYLGNQTDHSHDRIVTARSDRMSFGQSCYMTNHFDGPQKRTPIIHGNHSQVFQGKFNERSQQNVSKGPGILYENQRRLNSISDKSDSDFLTGESYSRQLDTNEGRLGKSSKEALHSDVRDRPFVNKDKLCLSTTTTGGNFSPSIDYQYTNNHTMIRKDMTVRSNPGINVINYDDPEVGLVPKILGHDLTTGDFDSVSRLKISEQSRERPDIQRCNIEPTKRREGDSKSTKRHFALSNKNYLNVPSILEGTSSVSSPSNWTPKTGEDRGRNQCKDELYYEWGELTIGLEIPTSNYIEKENSGGYHHDQNSPGSIQDHVARGGNPQEENYPSEDSTIEDDTTEYDGTTEGDSGCPSSMYPMDEEEHLNVPGRPRSCSSQEDVSRFSTKERLQAYVNSRPRSHSDMKLKTYLQERSKGYLTDVLYSYVNVPRSPDPYKMVDKEGLSWKEMEGKYEGRKSMNKVLEEEEEEEVVAEEKSLKHRLMPEDGLELRLEEADIKDEDEENSDNGEFLYILNYKYSVYQNSLRTKNIILS